MENIIDSLNCSEQIEPSFEYEPLSIPRTDELRSPRRELLRNDSTHSRPHAAQLRAGQRTRNWFGTLNNPDGADLLLDWFEQGGIKWICG